ncbi:hypothetical protein ASG43_00125 [Aureimonas sp. Leaf454]|uniref:DUF6492 family protein n=1 Tax=Aureimonas sp. Leaf454 TaxID=1736381 RepID=UPI0006F89868|nr:DUF6492 family protein [Aureimonas sp. Leaf454]KQT54084.1 hypothetical protein ASG43_00125 [Aureimonas sp. Leaf454]
MQTAIVTPSYSGDFERCRLLCESIDRRVTGYTDHYILVEKGDLDLFEALAGPRRRIVDERSILPAWLTVVPDPLSLGRRRLWLSPYGLPLRGWHVQQLRKIAMAALLDEDAVLFCDSDTVFVREADIGDQWTEGRLAFFRKPGAIGSDMAEHLAWSARAGRLLGTKEETTHTDYIAQAVAWRGDTVRGMIGRIESISGRSWAAAVAARRTFSEYLFYGRYVDEIEQRPDRHAPIDTPLCLGCWTGATLAGQNIETFFRQAGPYQPVVGIQSFIGADVGSIRRAAGLA